MKTRRGGHGLVKVAVAAALVMGSITAGTVATGLVDRTQLPAAVTLPGQWTDVRPFADHVDRDGIPVPVQMSHHAMVLLSGGRCRPHCGEVLAVGASSNDARTATATAQFFNPPGNDNGAGTGLGAGTWSEAAPPADARQSADAVYLPGLGKVLVTGGVSPCEMTTYGYDQCHEGGVPYGGDAKEPPLPDVPPTPAVYDIGSGTWSNTGPMAKPQFAARAVLIGDPQCPTTLSCSVLVVGGTAPVAEPGYDVLGGEKVWSDPGDLAEIYEPGTNSWRSLKTLPALYCRPQTQGAHQTCFQHPAGSTLTRLTDGTVLATGLAVAARASGTGISDVPPDPRGDEIFDPGTESFHVTGQSRARHNYGGATLLTSGPNAGKVLVFGGPDVPSNGSDSELFDANLSGGRFVPTGGETMPSMVYGATPSMDWPLERLPTAPLPDGRVLIANGTDAEIYNPTPGLWTATGSMTHGRYSHALTTLADGRALVSGGIASGLPVPIVGGGGDYAGPAELWYEVPIDAGSSSPTPAPPSTAGATPAPVAGATTSPVPSASDEVGSAPGDRGGEVPSGAAPGGSGAPAGNVPGSSADARSTAVNSSPSTSLTSPANRLRAGRALGATPSTISPSYSAIGQSADAFGTTSAAGRGSRGSPTPSGAAREAGPAVRPITGELLIESAATEPPGGWLGAGLFVLLLSAYAVVACRPGWI